MAIVVGTNSYISVEDANTYATDRNQTSFLNLFDEEKEALLISAADFMDTLVWVGTASSEIQAMAWPRNAIYYDPKYGVEVTLTDETPVEIVEAQVELALYFTNNGGGFTGKITSDATNSGPDSITVGSIQLSGLRENINGTTVGGVLLPTMVANLVGHLLGISAASSSGLYRPTFRVW